MTEEHPQHAEQSPPHPYDALLEEHKLLLSNIGGIQQWCSQRDELGDPNFGELATRVAHLREQLVAHFDEEERDGYLSSALEVAPRFCEQAKHLREEHAQVLDELDELSHTLASDQHGGMSWVEASERFEAFVAKLHAHECSEHEILQDAFGEDIGTGD